MCINAADAAEVKDNPLKNNKKGIDPPIKPIKTNNPHCFFVIVFIVLNSLAAKSILSKNTDTITPLRNVNTEESMVAKLNLFMKIAIPLIIAVPRTNNTPFFLFINVIETKVIYIGFV